MRFFRILLSTILCALLFFVAAFLQDPATESDTVFTAIGNALFVLVVLGPISLPWILVLAAALAVMDARGLGRLWQHVLVWSANGLVIGAISAKAAATSLLVLLAQSALVGVVYWGLAGRLAGKPETLLTEFADRPPREQLVLAVAILATLAAAVWVIRESVKAFGPV